MIDKLKVFIDIFSIPLISISQMLFFKKKFIFLTDFITSQLPDMDASLWIGLRWTAYEKINKWMDNRQLTYSNFHPLLVGRRLQIPPNVSLFVLLISTACSYMKYLISSTHYWVMNNGLFYESIYMEHPNRQIYKDRK